MTAPVKDALVALLALFSVQLLRQDLLLLGNGVTLFLGLLGSFGQLLQPGLGGLGFGRLVFVSRGHIGNPP